MITFYSDTQTRPSRAMLEAAFDAPVGDEQRGEDPTTNALCDRVADMLGQEAAVFLPSGTMANEIAIAVHCRPGDEVICDRTSHIVNFEGGGPAALSGVMVAPLNGQRGRFTAKQVADAARDPSRYAPVSRLVAVEQTANLGGGAVWEAEALDQVAAEARAHGLALHMDGARLMNAVVASGETPARFATRMDSVWVDFTKGLGCPVGAALAGSREFIAAAWRFKQMWGGAMRQSGVLAAMALWALDHNVERLAEDHALAARLAEALGNMKKVASVVEPETNILFFDIRKKGPRAARLAEALAADGIAIGPFGPDTVRLVTHMDVGPSDADSLLSALAKHLD